MRRWTLRARFLLLLIGLLVAVFLAITLVIVQENRSTLHTTLVNESKSFAGLATQPIGDAFVLYQNSGTIRITQQVEQFTSLDPDINQVEIVDTSGHPVYINNPSQPIHVTTSAATSLSPSYIYQGGNLVAIVQPYLENFGIHRYAIAYGISYKSVDRDISNIVTFIIILSAAILVASVGIWYFLINRLFLRPVANLSRTALLVSKGDLDRQIHLGRNDEIGDLADAVETMTNSLKADIGKLKEVDQMKNEFMMITSHNLRTPLSIIAGYIDEINSLESPTDELRQKLEVIAANVTRLGGFAEDVLTISTIEAGENILHLEPTEIEPILKTIVKEFIVQAKQKKLHFKATIDTTATVNLSKPQFRSALWNLLDNAYKFTAEDGHIELEAHTIGNQLEILVKDTGIGIAASEMPRLFTKFHRATDTLQYDYEGTGIGLYIAKLIIEQHGGTITVQSIQGQGSAFTISLPIMPAPVKSEATEHGGEGGI